MSKKKTTVETGIDNSKDKNLFEAYVDKFGNKYYGFIDTEQAPRCRIAYCERAARYAEMYISETNFKKAAVSMREAYNKQDFFKLGSIVEEIEYCSNFLGEEESLLEIAAGFFVMNNEDPYDMFTKDVHDKCETWKKDNKALDFFLRTAMLITKNYSQKSPEEILNFFKSLPYLARKKKLSRLIS